MSITSVCSVICFIMCLMQQTPNVDILTCSSFHFSFRIFAYVWNVSASEMCSVTARNSCHICTLVWFRSLSRARKWRLLCSFLDSLHGSRAFVANLRTYLNNRCRRWFYSLCQPVTLADLAMMCISITAIDHTVWTSMQLCFPMRLIGSLLRSQCNIYTL